MGHSSLWLWLSNYLVLHSYFEIYEIFILAVCEPLWSVEYFMMPRASASKRCVQTRLATRGSARSLVQRPRASGLQTWNICKAFDEFRQVFDPGLNDTALRDSINQVDEVLSDGESSSNDKQEQKVEESSEENYREEVGNGSDRGIHLMNRGLKGHPYEVNKRLKSRSGWKHLIESQQRAIKDSAAQIDLYIQK